MDRASPSLKNRSRVASRRGRIWLPLCLILLLVLLIQGIRASVATNRLLTDLHSLQDLSPQAGLTALQSDQPGDLETRITQAAQDLGDLRAAIGPLVYILPSLSWVPHYGADMANAPALMDFGDHLLTSARQTARIGRSTLATIKSGQKSGQPIGVSLLQASEAQSGEIRQAQRDLAQAMQTRSHIDLSGLTPALRKPLERMDRWLPLWKIGLDSLAVAPTLLGADRPRLYLLIAQNSDELRATGGFITGVAELRVDRGEIAVGEFQDSYAVLDSRQIHPAPPTPLAKYIYAWRWLFRDSNWSPDFPTAARTAETIYQIDRGVAADGVIAFDLQAVPPLLKALGPLILEPNQDIVDAGNVLTKIQMYWATPRGQDLGSNPWEHRKDFMGQLLQAVMLRARSGDLDQAPLAQALYEALAAKDLLVYVNDFEDASEQNWPGSGRLYQGDADALMVVDSNVGFNKVGPSIERQAEYTVSIDPAGDAFATLVITHTNRSPVDGTTCVRGPAYPLTYGEMQQGCYWNYLRVVAPVKSQLLRASENLDVTAEPNPDARAVFGGAFVVPRGASHTTRLEYRLPTISKGGSGYQLHLEKQPGAPPMTIWVEVAYPESWQITSANPHPIARSNRSLDFQVVLDRDQEIWIRFQ